MSACYRPVCRCVRSRRPVTIRLPMAAAATSTSIVRLATTTALAVVVAAALLLVSDPLRARAAAIAGVCLVLWLSEAIPLYATTIVLWAGIALLLGPLDGKTF